jgi:hypothetical protein
MRPLAIIFFTLFCFTLGAQNEGAGILQVPSNAYDFGRIMEDGGSVKHRFEFMNSGSGSLSISNVRTTCGCTIPVWTKEPVIPGKSGFVEVEFNPEGRAGDFHKTIQIQSTAANANMFLTISGTVVPALKEEELHYQLGGLAIKADQVNLGYLYKGATGVEHITVRNSTGSVMEVKFSDVPDYIILDAIPSILKPEEYGQIEVHYCTEKVDDWDIVIDQVSLLLNNVPVKDKKLSIIANIREDFRGLTPEQKEVAPKAEFNAIVYRLDTINSGSPVECKFMIKNTGKSDLKIRAVKASCGCTAVKPEKSNLAPGDSAWVSAIFDPKGRSGDFKNGITVVTNDPFQYKKYLYMEGYIAGEEK